MADEAIESTAIDGLQGKELMGRPLRINKAEPRGSGGSRRGGRGGYGGGTEVVVIMVATEVAAMAVAIMDLMVLTLINLLEQKVGKTEAMEILLIILNMKTVGAEEKGACPMRAMLQTRQINNPFLQVLSLI